MKLAKTLPTEYFQLVILILEKPKIVWFTTFKGSILRLEGEIIFPMAMNASSIEQATKIDYFITNFQRLKVTSQWMVNT